MINLEYDKSKSEAPYYLELVDMNWEYPIKSNRIGYWCDKAHLKQQLEKLLKEFDKNDILELIRLEYSPEFKTGDLVLVRYSESDAWELDIYGRCVPSDAYPYKCVGSNYSFCIPYKDNEEKLGTCLEE